MNDPQIAIQLHWIAQAIYKLADATVLGAFCIMWGCICGGK